MADWLTREQRSRNMSAIRSTRNCSTEEALVALFRRHGVKGWRRHQKLLGRPDFVFIESRTVVFTDGCFWHGCPRCYRAPEDNTNYWHLKVSRNRRRDRSVVRQLRAAGWSVVRIWEHDLKADGGRLRVVSRVRAVLERRGREGT